VLTWHVHGNYLWYLSQVPVTWHVPVLPGRPPGYAGRGTSFPFPSNVVEVDAAHVRDMDFDVVLHQSHRTWLEDRHELLSSRQRRLPTVVLEHDPPRASPTDTVHPVHRADDGALVVHVTSFNRLMWDNGSAPTTVIEHGVDVPDVDATLELERGLVVVNDLATRGRRLGADVVAQVREQVPLDIVGMRSEAVGGLGEVPPPELPAFMARYRFFFHPVRYTSLGLAVCEAMAIGLPVVGLATTELVTVIDDGINGYIDTNPDRLVERMQLLLDRRDHARRMGVLARAVARRRFAIERFAQDWWSLLHEVAAEGVRAAAGS
jgi:hypothetical protein